MPRFPGARLAFRTWVLEGGVLRAAGGDAWVNGEPTQAHCNARHYHPRGEPVPSGECSCGLHAYFVPPANLYLHTGVLGAVVMWGHSVYQSDGLRTEYGLPVALCGLPTMQLGVYEAARLYCDEWEVPWCKTVDDLIDEGLRYADVVPKEEWTKPGDPDVVHSPSGFEAAPPPIIRGLGRQRTGLPRFQAAKMPYKRGANRHAQRRAARARLRANKARRI